MQNLKKEIIEFWFGPDFEKHPLQNAKKWFEKSASFDALVSDKFKDQVEHTLIGDFDEWKQTAPGSMAMILLTDQFSRNIFRGTKESFAYDSIGLATAKEGIARGFDKELTWIERTFFYLPFEHAEDLALQEKSILLFQGLMKDVPKEYIYHADEALDYAVKHWEIIKLFGRFPHRNAILNRISTEEELEFLKQPGSSF